MFRPLSLGDKKKITEFLNEYKSISCEMCFGNLFVWSSLEDTEYYVKEDILYLRNREGYYFPISTSDADYKKAVAHIININSEIRFINLFAPEAEFLYKNFGFKIIERRELSEYIYEADRLRTFAGRKLHGKKNHLNRFYAQYSGSYEYENINKRNIQECLRLSWEWRNLNELYVNESILTELDMVRRFIENYDNLDLCGGCIKINGDIKAFTIGERAFAGSDCVVVHIEKAVHDEIDGIYPAICSLFLQAHPEFRYVNREDDLGDEGLRRSKLSYRPLYLLDRYEAEV